jgi:hypothetical protein
MKAKVLNSDLRDGITIGLSWTRQRVLLHGVSPALKEQLINGSLLQNALPGAEIQQTYGNTEGVSRAGDWCIQCVNGPPRITYHRRRRTIIYQFDREVALEHDVINLMLQIVELFADQQSSALMIHGSLIAHNSTSVLLLGPPLSGKTTVTVEAITSGWSCGAGERLIFDAKNRTLMAGTPFHHLNIGITERFFPSLRPGFLSRQEICPPHGAESKLHEAPVALMVVPKVTDRSPVSGVLSFALTRNMALRFMSLDTGRFASGAFSLCCMRLAAGSLDTCQSRSRRLTRAAELCSSVPAFFIEGHPSAVVEWLDKWLSKAQ